MRRVRTLPEVEVGWSAISVPYARGFHLKPHAAKGPAEAFQRGSEFGHLHPEQDGSLHLNLPPALYNDVLRAGWGEPHPISGTMLVFGPRDEVELEVVWRLVCASYHWATATENHVTPATQSNDNRLARVISGRSGPFWDAVAGRAPLPPAAATLGLEPSSPRMPRTAPSRSRSTPPRPTSWEDSSRRCSTTRWGPAELKWDPAMRASD